MDVAAAGPRSTFWSADRNDFALDPQALHLNHGSFGGVPRTGLAAQYALRDEMETRPVVWFGQLAARMAAARIEVARFLQVPPEQLAFVPNPSAGASVIFAAGLLAPGSRIVVTDHGYGAVTGGARRLARRIDGTLTTVDIPLAATAPEVTARLAPVLATKPALLVIDQITSATARMFPVAEICQLARAHGVLTLVDGAHAPGMLACPAVPEADFWIGALHKWVCAPRGSAALVTASELRDRLYPLIDSWHIDQPYPQRFDIQGTGDDTPVLAAGATIDYLADRYGWADIRQHNADLAAWAADYLAEQIGALADIDAAVALANPAPSMRLVRLPGTAITNNDEAQYWRDRYAAAGTHLAFTTFGGHSYLRLSAAVYNTPEDYQRFAADILPGLINNLLTATRSERKNP